MLRGVNKQIIEINETGNIFFERALLFVRPQYLELGARRLESEANKFLLDISKKPPARGVISLRRRRRTKRIILCSIIVAIGIAAGAVIFLALR